VHGITMTGMRTWSKAYRVQRSGNPALRAPSTIRSNSLRNVGLSEYPDPSCASCSTVKPGRTLSSSATAAAASAFCPRQAYAEAAAAVAELLKVQIGRAHV